MTSEHVPDGPAWAEYLTDEERATVELLGRRPPDKIVLDEGAALIVIDAVAGFTGTRPLPLQEAVQEFSTSCGERAWETLPTISRLVDTFRAAGLPVLWTRNSVALREHTGSTTTISVDDRVALEAATRFLPDLEPAADEFVLEKPRASAFFQTPMLLALKKHAVSRVVLVGGTTSGCVRASAVDASSYGFEPVVVSDGCFDRFGLSHTAALFDLQERYGDVVAADNLIFRAPAAERNA